MGPARRHGTPRYARHPARPRPPRPGRAAGQGVPGTRLRDGRLSTAPEPARTDVPAGSSHDDGRGGTGLAPCVPPRPSTLDPGGSADGQVTRPPVEHGLEPLNAVPR